MKKRSNPVPTLQPLTTSDKHNAAVQSACCAPRQDASPCCNPSATSTENVDVCCAQPADGSPCCIK